MYGQTGSGKTYTMMGKDNKENSMAFLSNTQNCEGLLSRSLKKIFQKIEQANIFFLNFLFNLNIN